jgi:hypothetical protein
MDDARRLAAAAAAQSIGAEQHAALVLATHADLWLGDGAAAAHRIERLGEMGRHGRAVDASETTLRAGAAHSPEILRAGMYETAISSWRALRLPLHLALCLAGAVDSMPLALAPSRPGADEVADVLEDLGATGMLHLLRPDAAIESHASPSDASSEGLSPVTKAGGSRPSSRSHPPLRATTPRMRRSASRHGVRADVPDPP